MLALIFLAAVATPQTNVLLRGDVLLACHRKDVGWFTGDACELLAEGLTVENEKGERRKLGKARDYDYGCGFRRVMGDNEISGLWRRGGGPPAGRSKPG